MQNPLVGRIVLIVGAALALIAIVKFSIIGYYPDEALPWFAVLAVGAVLALIGEVMHRRAKEGRR